MPTYTLVPDEHDFEPEEFTAEGPAQLLEMVYGCGWNAARVLQDGMFVFVVARSASGVWSILPGLAGADKSSIDAVRVNALGAKRKNYTPSLRAKENPRRSGG